MESLLHDPSVDGLLWIDDAFALEVSVYPQCHRQCQAVSADATASPSPAVVAEQELMALLLVVL